MRIGGTLTKMSWSSIGNVQDGGQCIGRRSFDVEFGIDEENGRYTDYEWMNEWMIPTGALGCEVSVLQCITESSRESCTANERWRLNPYRTCMYPFVFVQAIRVYIQRMGHCSVQREI